MDERRTQQQLNQKREVSGLCVSSGGSQPKLMVKQFAGRLRDVLMQFACLHAAIENIRSMPESERARIIFRGYLRPVESMQLCQRISLIFFHQELNFLFKIELK